MTVDYVGKHRAVDPDETIEIPVVRVWPSVEPETGDVVAMWPRIVPEPKPAGLVRRFVRRFKAVRWSGTRVAAAVSSGMVLGATGAAALWQVIR
ncbi:hypothetical protein [Amycolatopsis japonica]